jgi:hypothetical protein
LSFSSRRLSTSADSSSDAANLDDLHKYLKKRLKLTDNTKKNIISSERLRKINFAHGHMCDSGIGIDAWAQ